MSEPRTAAYIHRDPDMAIFDGPDAEILARQFGLLDSLRQSAQAAVAKSGRPRQILATYVHENVFLGLVCWHGFAEAKDNGLFCCLGRCTEPEHMPVVLLKLSEFFALAISQHPHRWGVN